jgi:hypothetical protein
LIAFVYNFPHPFQWSLNYIMSLIAEIKPLYYGKIVGVQVGFTRTAVWPKLPKDYPAALPRLFPARGLITV